MTALTLDAVARAVGGQLTRDDENAVVAYVSTDSRRVADGTLFVALRGERFDAHDFIADVAAAGATAAIVEHEPTTPLAMPLTSMPLIVVPDARVALGRLAADCRERAKGCKVVGIAGSNGKTTTKHLVHAALTAGKLRGTMSPKSFNNDVGVPLTLLAAEPWDHFVVVEIGTNHPGEVANLAAIARPDVGVITNVGSEHLEFFGDLHGVRREESSLVDGIRPDGTLVVHGDDAALLDAVSRFTGRVLRFGFDAPNDVRAIDVRVDAHGTSFGLDGRRVHVPMIGRHNALNALAALGVARAFGVADDDAIRGLAASIVPEMRMQRLDAGGVTILNDAYNANPSSMAAAIEALAALPCAGRRVAVLGDMRELGTTSEVGHREVGRLVAARGDAIARLACVGVDAQWIAESAVAHGFEAPINLYDDAAAAAPAVASALRAGDLVLVKGSRGMRLERIVDRIVGG